MDKINEKKRIGLNLVKTIQKNDFINFIDFFVSLKKVFILNAKFKEGYVLDISYFLSKDLRFYTQKRQVLKQFKLIKQPYFLSS